MNKTPNGTIATTTGTSNSETGSTSMNTFSEMTAEQEFFLYELETTDSSSVGLILRAIYDSGNVYEFSRALERRITHYDKNILKVCTYHYQGFLDSVKGLSGLGTKCENIKEVVSDVNDQIQKDGQELKKVSEEIVRYRKMQRNANVAIDQISMCLPVLDNYVKLQDLMKQKKYLQALKVLEELEHTYFPNIHKYRFTQTLTKNVLPIRKQIRENSYSELTDFLENLQKICGQVGEDASKHTADQYAMLNNAESRKSKDSDANERQKDGSEIRFDKQGAILRSSPQRSAINGKLTADEDESGHQSAQDKIDYAPIHRCCQVFNVLGEKEAFERYYREQRREQALVVSKTPSKVAESIHSYVKYLNEIIGFFVVEDRIMQIQPTLVTALHKDHLWEIALNEVTSAMNAHFGNCLEVELMLRMKKIILSFILTMKSYGYNITPLYHLLQSFRDQYNEILMRQYCLEFETTLSTDNYSPITVKNEEELRAILKEFPQYKRGQESDKYPRQFPYSSFVPKVFSQAKHFLKGCLNFMNDLQMANSDVEDTVRRYANVLLSRWSASLKDYVTSKNRSLVQLVQITINMGYLEKSCDSLERYISKITSRGEVISGSSSHLVTLKEQIFQDARLEVEQLIDEALKNKVNEFMELANYDWELLQPSGVSSGYITDLINFLNTTFLSFTNLPSQLARHICMQICKYLADRLHSMLLSPNFKVISKGALEQFSLDVMQCEMFANQRPVTGFDDSTLIMTFAHLRQLLDLVMNADWTVYLAERGQNSRYIRVRANDAATLLEKIIEFEKKNSGFFGGKQERKKLYETILRKIRSMTN